MNGTFRRFLLLLPLLFLHIKNICIHIFVEKNFHEFQTLLFTCADRYLITSFWGVFNPRFIELTFIHFQRCFIRTEFTELHWDFWAFFFFLLCRFSRFKLSLRHEFSIMEMMKLNSILKASFWVAIVISYYILYVMLIYYFIYFFEFQIWGLFLNNSFIEV